MSCSPVTDPSINTGDVMNSRPDRLNLLENHCLMSSVPTFWPSVILKSRSITVMHQTKKLFETLIILSLFAG